MQVPDDLAGDIVNVTATGQSYVEFKFKNVTTTDTFQVRSEQTVHVCFSLTLYLGMFQILASCMPPVVKWQMK
jgi:hypothetical protein